MPSAEIAPDRTRVRKIYLGFRTSEGWVDRVTVNDKPLHNYSDSSDFEWGYGGAGPHALAISILCDFFEVPVSVGGTSWSRIVPPWGYYWETFLQEVVSEFPNRQSFRLTSDQITDWMDAKPPYEDGAQEVLATKLRR